MATEIGIIKTLVGTAVATALDGSQRNLQAGDRVYQDEVISTGAAGAIEIGFADGSAMTLGRSSQVILDIDVFNPQDVAQAPEDAARDVKAIQQALLDGADPSLVTDATAAGAGTTGNSNEGIDIIQVIHESQEVTPEAGFDTTGFTDEIEEDSEEDAIFDVALSEDDEVSTNEDVALTIDVLSNDSVGSGGGSITDFNQPANGTVVLNDDGTFTYTPAANFSGEDSFTYTVTDGDGDSAIATATVNVVAVADAPNLIISVGSEVDHSVSETIDINNVSTTDNGFIVTAYDINGDGTSISTVSGTNHDGFGVSGRASGANTEIGSNKNGSERLEVQFDYVVSSIGVSFAWLSGKETAAYTFYLNGVQVGSGTTAFQSDTVDGTFTLTPGSDFDRVDFTAPLKTVDDYLVNSITFNKVTSFSYELDVQATLTDVDGSESLSGVSITGLPTGVSIVEVANSDGTYNSGTLTLVSDHELSETEINGILGSVTSTDGTDTATTNSNAKVETDYIGFAGLDLVSWGSAQNQDRAPGSATTVDANVLALTGNSWKGVALTELGVDGDFDWSNGILTFEAKVDVVGEIQGVLLDNNLQNNNRVDKPNLIQIDGTQSWGKAAFDSEDLGDGWMRVEVDLSSLDQSSGQFNNLVFVNDDDSSSGGIGSISFRNLSISDDAIAVNNTTDILLEGTSGGDVLSAAAGNDILIGGEGDDILFGGAGNDEFVWNSSDVGTVGTPAHDTVEDFNGAEDVLNLSDLLSDGSHSIEGLDNGSGELQLTIKDGGGNTVQEIELSGVATAGDANATLQSLLDSGAINDGI